jgi:hypothetical protein
VKTYHHFIDGEYVQPLGGQWMDSMDPYKGQPWAQIARGDARDVDRAVQAASRAMRSGPWASMTATQRGKLMLKLADLVAANAERLAEIEVRDNGKLLAEMRGQLNYHPEWWRYFGGLADKIEGSVMPIDKPDMMAFTRHEPVGVVGALTAWNSPLLFIAWKCAPAIAAGCTVVVKPSEFASVSTLEFAALTREAGFPNGVFNVVTGLGAEAGSALVDHPDVAKITFTGSDATGARIYAQAAKTMKRVSLELGGKSPNIVFDDCDLDKARRRCHFGHFCGHRADLHRGLAPAGAKLHQRRIHPQGGGPGRLGAQGRPHAGRHPHWPGHHARAVPKNHRLHGDCPGRRRALHLGRWPGPALGRADRRPVCRAHHLHRRHAPDAHCPGRGVWPGAVHHWL